MPAAFPQKERSAGAQAAAKGGVPGDDRSARPLRGGFCGPANSPAQFPRSAPRRRAERAVMSPFRAIPRLFSLSTQHRERCVLRVALTCGHDLA